MNKTILYISEDWENMIKSLVNLEHLELNFA